MAFLGLDTHKQKTIFIFYISLWVSYGLLNEFAKRSHVNFNSAAAVVMQCILKLGIASYMFIKQDGSMYKLFEDLKQHQNLFLLYMIPSALYTVYDILAYINLKTFDPPTYFLLLQFRMVVTGLIHQQVFQKVMNRNQWVSIAITTLGCVVKTIGDTAALGADKPINFLAYGLLLVQIFGSTFAGVYNEALLKKQKKVSLNLQNIIMYLDSIFCVTICLMLGLSGQSFTEAINPTNVKVLFTPYVLPMVVIMSCIGVVTSMFLKYLDSVRKAIASALELVVLPILSSMLFSIPINGYLVFSVALVSFGVYLYSVPVPKEVAQHIPEADKSIPLSELKDQPLAEEAV